MAERRKSNTSTRRRTRSDRDEREELDEEPESLEEDEIVDADESGEADDELPETDEADEPDEPDEPEEPDRRGRPAMTAGEAAKVALRQLATLTSKQPEGVTEIARTEDGWTVGVELVEDQRIPSSADILATYETTVDEDGELVSYRRVRRYPRGRGDAEE